MEVGNVSTAASSSAATADRGLGDVSAGDFMNILIKQLQYQDPFEPMGNEEMLNQMSTIRELELTSRLTEKLDQLTDQQRFASVASLIGKFARGEVTGDDGTLFPVEGVVNSITFTEEGNVILELDNGENLPLSKLKFVSASPQG
jgi:flagellar basal-body rod modification protein FlgD